jgi:hypothetical protein
MSLVMETYGSYPTHSRFGVRADTLDAMRDAC